MIEGDCMHPYEFMFFAGVVLAFLLVAAFWWFVEEFWWLLLIVLIVVAIAYCKRGFENEKWLKSIQATEYRRKYMRTRATLLGRLGIGRITINEL